MTSRWPMGWAGVPRALGCRLRQCGSSLNPLAPTPAGWAPCWPGLGSQGHRAGPVLTCGHFQWHPAEAATGRGSTECGVAPEALPGCQMEAQDLGAPCQPHRPSTPAPQRSLC